MSERESLSAFLDRVVERWLIRRGRLRSIKPRSWPPINHATGHALGCPGGAQDAFGNRGRCNCGL